MKFDKNSQDALDALYEHSKKPYHKNSVLGQTTTFEALGCLLDFAYEGHAEEALDTIEAHPEIIELALLGLNMKTQKEEAEDTLCDWPWEG